MSHTKHKYSQEELSQIFNNDSNGSVRQHESGMTDEEIKKALNIPPRDEENYPEIPRETQLKAGSFLYKLNLIASGADGNLQSLIWTLYDNMDDFLRLSKDEAFESLGKTLVIMRNYLQEHPNILFGNEKSNSND